MSILFKKNIHPLSKEELIDIEWNGLFIAGYDVENWNKIPKECHDLLKEMMKEVWLHGNYCGKQQIQKQFKNLIGI